MEKKASKEEGGCMTEESKVDYSVLLSARTWTKENCEISRKGLSYRTAWTGAPTEQLLKDLHEIAWCPDDKKEEDK